MCRTERGLPSEEEMLWPVQHVMAVLGHYLGEPCVGDEYQIADYALGYYWQIEGNISKMLAAQIAWLDVEASDETAVQKLKRINFDNLTSLQEAGRHVMPAIAKLKEFTYPNPL